MDYDQLISLAKSKAQHAESLIKKPKPKTSGPDPKAIESFLIKKRLSEIRKEEEERAKRARLLELRSQNSKSSKKAKLMSSRTKDNDYSKINLSERDIQNKERVDNQLRSKRIDNKLDRMKQRIELEEQEDDQPRRRKKRDYSAYKEKLEDVNYNYSYDKKKKEREEMLKKPSVDNQVKTAKPAARPPPSYEQLLEMAMQQKEKKTLEEEIEEEISSKHKSIDKDDLKKRAELYQKSLTSKRKATASKSAINIDDDHSTSKHNLSSNKSVYPSTSSKDHYKTDRFESKADQSRPFKDRPIPKLSNKSNIDSNQEGNNIDRILSSKSGKLASKIASLSKEELLELSNAVKRAEKRKSFSKDEEYSPRASVDEYRPKPFFKSTNEQTYIPTKIKNTNHHREEEYDPISNYKTSRSSVEKQFKAKQPNQIKQQPNGRLFDIDSLTPEEIEKIRRERMEKQKKEAAAAAKSSIQKSQPPKPMKSNDNYTSPVRPPTKPSRQGSYLPPIGANYVRGMYDSSYYDDQNEDEYEDEEDDDDMRDFIDDGDDSYGIPNSIRDEIDKIFKYKRNKYQDFDDDDIEEASYAQQMMEENRSARIGYLEDLEEERKEEMERRKKAKLKKKGYRISSDEDD